MMKLQVIFLLSCTSLSTSNIQKSLKKRWIEEFKDQQSDDPPTLDGRNSSELTPSYSVTFQGTRITYFPVPQQSEASSSSKGSSVVNGTNSLPSGQVPTICEMTMKCIKENSQKNNSAAYSLSNSTFLKNQKPNTIGIKRALSQGKSERETIRDNQLNSSYYAQLNESPSFPKRPKLSQFDTSTTPKPKLSIIIQLSPSTIPQSVGICQVENESKHYKASNGILNYRFKYGIFSWVGVRSENRKFDSWFTFREIGKSLSIGSNTFETILIFKYACETVSLLGLSKKKDAAIKIEVSFELIEEIIQIIYSIDSHLRPPYYLFGPNTKNSNTQMRIYLRSPFYFLFTAISTLLSEGKSKVSQSLKSLIKISYCRIKASNYFQSHRWNFLHAVIYETLPQPHKKIAKNNNKLQYDITIINYIYQEMKQNGNEQVRNFFIKVWNAHKEEDKNEGERITISNNPQFVIPILHESRLSSSERAIRKLYQIEFTKFLFSKWCSFSDLIKKYLKLKKDFGPFSVDFRLRIFSRRDFDSLKGAIDKIDFSIRNYFNSLEYLSPIDILNIRCFFIELVNFIRFKCVIFTYDYQNEPNKVFDYEETFSVIKAIITISKGIVEFLSSNGFRIEEHFILSSIDRLNHLNPIDLTVFRKEFLDLEKTKHIIFYSDYLIISLNYFDLTRFKCSELIEQLDESINQGNYQQVFENGKYEELRKLWKDQSKNHLKLLSPEDKKYYVEQFRIFLFHYNQ